MSLRSADADFSCFADLALVSPDDYYREGEGSLMQCVLTPADPYLPLPNEEIAKRVDAQVRTEDVHFYLILPVWRCVGGHRTWHAMSCCFDAYQDSNKMSRRQGCL